MTLSWTERSFGDLCVIRRGASPRPIHDWMSPTGIPWVKIADATRSHSRTIERTREFIRPEGKAKSVQVVPGDLILSNSATPGIPKFMGIEACIHDGWLLLREFDHLDKNFCYYLLKYERPRLLQKGNGSVFTNLKTDILRTHRVRIPLLPEQRAIASILGALDDKIELNRRMNETLEAMARAIFKSWFVDFDPVRAKAEGKQPFGMDQATADLFPDRLVESEIGPIPEGWAVTTLGQHMTLDKGLSYKGKHLVDTGTPLVNLKCINRNGGLRPDGMKYYNGEYKPRHVVQPGDIVIANTDLTQQREILGCPAFVPETGVDEAILTHHLYAARISIDSGLGPDFLFHLLLTETVRERARGFATGTTVLGLPRDAILEFSFALPNAELLSRFTNEASLLRSKRDKNRSQSRTLAELRDLLLPKLLSGEIRVKEAEHMVEAVA